MLAIALAPLRQNFCQRGPFRRRDHRAGEIFRLDFIGVIRRLDAERIRQIDNRCFHAACTRHPAVDRIALVDGLAHDVAEGLIGGDRHRRVERAGERAVGGGGAIEQHVERQPLQKLRLLGLVEHAEAGGDIGFERELVQQLRAESVDGLHFKAARRFQRAREQPPRHRPAPRVGRHVAMLANGVIERCIVERDPCGQPVEHLLRHIGRGRLGERDAEDFFRLAAVKQQIDHALRQHIGLAGAGVGGNPRRHVRIGSLALLPPHLAWDADRRSHSPTQMSSISPPVADHSLTRARWS